MVSDGVDGALGVGDSDSVMTGSDDGNDADDSDTDDG